MTPPVFLDWPGCSRLCKGPTRPDIVSVSFVWGPSDHVLRRFLSTTALPNLRELHTWAFSYTNGPIELYKQLRCAGRPLDKFILETAADLARSRRFRFELTPLPNDGICAKVAKLTENVTGDDIRSTAEGFGFSEYLLE
jgi:hypothetical protein